MPSQIRIFVVDDSVAFRKLLLTTINSIPGVRTVGVASNGKEAIDIIPTVKPDLITLDLNMPIMDGLQTLRELREVYPQFRVIVVSAYTSDGAQTTLKALEAGALDVITKPDTNDMELNSKLLHDQFISLLTKYADSEKNLDVAQRVAIKPAQVNEQVPHTQHLLCAVKPEIVAIGLSTGGPGALTELLPSLPAEFSLPILIVQHMPKLFTRTLAESLARKTTIRVVEAQDEEELRGGTVYIAPGGSQMKVRRGDKGEVLVQITDAPAENYCKPSADYLFRSVAQVYGEKALGVIMTGMGSDGVLGLRLMKRQGAQVIAQDRQSCTVWGMPRMAFEAGVVDIVLPLEEIAEELIRCAGR
jgi:two-component system chemotaxis response regulator CheB